MKLWFKTASPQYKSSNLNPTEFSLSYEISLCNEIIKSEFKFNQDFNKLGLYHYKFILGKWRQKVISSSSYGNLNPVGEVGGRLGRQNLLENARK